MTQSTLFKKTLLATLVPILAVTSHAATVRSDVDYQTFRDFAENKGDFTVGATNVTVTDTSGKAIGTVLNGVPMPDFGATDRLTGTVTLVDPQYAVSVAHNFVSETGAAPADDHLHSHQFGGQGFNPDAHHYNYAVVDTGADPDYLTLDGKHDYAVPRLSKLVTEVAPIAAAGTVGPLSDYQAGSDRYAAFVRVGSGIQGTLAQGGGNVLDIYNDSVAANLAAAQGNEPWEVCETGNVAGCTNLETAYHYLTGGETLPYVQGFGSFDRYEGVLFSGGNDTSGKPSTLQHSPLGNNEESGDSGSPVYGYNKQTGRWELVGVLGGSLVAQDPNTFENTETWSYAIASRPEYNNALIEERDTVVTGTNYRWSQSGTNGTLTGSNTINAGLSTDATTPSASGYEVLMDGLHNGETLHFEGRNGTLTLATDINQGAGALYFNENFTVKGQTGAETHLGAGVVVADGKTVTWQVHNPEGDRLSKLGAGTLLVNGGGNNRGDISVGDGTVILNQQGGQAFNQVGIVSGRGTVVLQGENQVNPDNIYFGYRGGRLDTHGKDLTFSYVQNVDAGAHIANNNASDASNITITGRQALTPEEFANSGRGLVGIGFNGGIYAYRGDNSSASRGQSSLLPVEQKNDINYIYLGSADRTQEAGNRRILTYINHENSHNAKAAFHGFLGEKDASRPNGTLNVTFSPDNRTNEQLLMLTGGSNLNGELSATAGTLLLSGRPVSYAANMQTKEEVVKDDKWHNADFVASAFKASGDAKLYAGRNVGKVQGNIALSDNARATLGFVKGDTPICVRSEYHGEVQCDTAITDAGLASLGRTAVTGDVTMTGNSRLNLGKADLTGKVTADRTTTMNLSPEARWVMTEDSTVGNLAMQDGSVVTLSRTPNNLNTLTVGGNLSGKGQFNYNTEAGTLKGDKVSVQGVASGDFKLLVRDTGVEPTHSDDLVLMTVQNAQNLAVSLANAGQTVDVGALKYTLKTDDGLTYYLDNPFVPPV
ncbi:MAG: S6 family peptidase, partial [Moraxella sp.]|nr:S6 family peptidase [Moraxella sp.]